MKKKDTISAEELDKKFDAGKDITKHLDFSKAQRAQLPPPEEFIETKKERVNL